MWALMYEENIRTICIDFLMIKNELSFTKCHPWMGTGCHMCFVPGCFMYTDFSCMKSLFLHRGWADKWHPLGPNWDPTRWKGFTKFVTEF